MDLRLICRRCALSHSATAAFFVFMLPMPLGIAKGSLAMTTTIIIFIVFGCGLGGMATLAFETPDIPDRDE